MSVESTLSEDGKVLTIQVSGRFDYPNHQKFRSIYRQSDGTGMSYRVELGDAKYIDSSALGMLLLLKEHATAHNSEVVLVKPAGGIKEILSLSKFDDVFRIED